jgi:hypothetical protein
MAQLSERDRVKLTSWRRTCLILIEGDLSRLSKSLLTSGKAVESIRNHLDRINEIETKLGISEALD